MGKTNFQIPRLKHFSLGCSYYCFHNTYLLLKICRSSNAELIETYIKALNSPACYWRRNLSLKKFLKSRCLPSSDSFPWNEATLHSGVMERSYLRYILHSYPESQQLMIVTPSQVDDLRNSFNHFRERDQHSCIITLPDFCKGSITNNSLDNELVHFLSDVFKHFRKSTNHTTSFIIGSVNHWAVVLANKVHDQVEVLCVDSRMRDILNATEDELRKIVTDHYDESERLKKKAITYRPW